MRESNMPPALWFAIGAAVLCAAVTLYPNRKRKK